MNEFDPESAAEMAAVISSMSNEQLAVMTTIKTKSLERANKVSKHSRLWLKLLKAESKRRKTLPIT